MAAFNPLNYPASLSYPARLPKHTDDSTPLPFIMFLIELLRPKVFVELGTEDGASYCACCQTIKTLGLTSHCYSINVLEQSDESGAQAFAELKQYHDSLYQGFSKLTRNTCDTALMDFEDETIDLLYIKEERSYEVVKHLYQTWLPKMSERGAIIFHSTNNPEHSGRLWKEIEPLHPHFELPYGNGLGIISVSNNEASPLSALAQMSKDDASLLILFFQGLGQRLSIQLKREQQIERLSLESERKEVELQSLSSQLTHSLKNLEAVTQAWQMEYQTVLRKWGAKQKEMTEDKARAIQALSATLTRERELHQERQQQLLTDLTGERERHREYEQQFQTELQATSSELIETKARLDDILGSRAWRWVTRYGRVKATLLAPINRLFKQKVD